jgi:hypothetical protein
VSDFSQDDLFEAIDRSVGDLLRRVGIDEPPVDALHLARAAFGFRIEYAEPEDERQGRFGPRPARRPASGTIALRSDQSEESQQVVAARAVAKQLVPPILAKLGVVPGTEHKQAATQLVGLIAPRLLLPTRWFTADARRADFDLFALKDHYPSAGFEMLAFRMLDADDEPSVIAVIDDGAVTARRANRFPVTRALTQAEQACADRVAETEEPARVRADGWTAWGWPTPGIPFRRIIVRATPDGL